MADSSFDRGFRQYQQFIRRRPDRASYNPLAEHLFIQAAQPPVTTDPIAAIAHGVLTGILANQMDQARLDYQKQDEEAKQKEAFQQAIGLFGAQQGLQRAFEFTDPTKFTPQPLTTTQDPTKNLATIRDLAISNPAFIGAQRKDPSFINRATRNVLTEPTTGVLGGVVPKVKFEYKERTQELPDGTVQKYLSQDAGRTWMPQGEPYARWQPKDETPAHYTIREKSSGAIKSITLKPNEALPQGWELTSPTGGGAGDNTLEEARKAFIGGTATPEQKALLGQGEKTLTLPQIGSAVNTIVDNARAYATNGLTLEVDPKKFLEGLTVFSADVEAPIQKRIATMSQLMSQSQTPPPKDEGGFLKWIGGFFGGTEAPPMPGVTGPGGGAMPVIPTPTPGPSSLPGVPGLPFVVPRGTLSAPSPLSKAAEPKQADESGGLRGIFGTLLPGKPAVRPPTSLQGPPKTVMPQKPEASAKVQAEAPIKPQVLSILDEVDKVMSEIFPNMDAIPEADQEIISEAVDRGIIRSKADLSKYLKPTVDLGIKRLMKLLVD